MTVAEGKHGEKFERTMNMSAKDQMQIGAAI
jgi:hypothetical protein